MYQASNLLLVFAIMMHPALNSTTVLPSARWWRILYIYACPFCLFLPTLGVLGKVLVVGNCSRGPHEDRAPLQKKSESMATFFELLNNDETLVDAFREDLLFDRDLPHTTSPEFLLPSWLDMAGFVEQCPSIQMSRYYSWHIAFEGRLDREWSTQALLGRFMMELMGEWAAIDKKDAREEAEKALDRIRRSLREGAPIADAGTGDAEGVMVPVATVANEVSQSLADLRKECKNQWEVAIRLLQSRRLHIDARQINDVFKIFHSYFQAALKAQRSQEGASEWKARKACEEWIFQIDDLLQIPTCDAKLKRYGITTGGDILTWHDGTRHLDLRMWEGELEIAQQFMTLLIETASQRVYSQSWHSKCFPGVFNGLRHPDPESRVQQMKLIRTMWDHMLEAEMYLVDVAGNPAVKEHLQELLSDIHYHRWQYTLQFILLLELCHWDPESPDVQLQAWRQSSGRGNTKTCLEDLFRVMRLREKSTTRNNLSDFGIFFHAAMANCLEPIVDPADEMPQTSQENFMRTLKLTAQEFGIPLQALDIPRSLLAQKSKQNMLRPECVFHPPHQSVKRKRKPGMDGTCLTDAGHKFKTRRAAALLPIANMKPKTPGGNTQTGTVLKGLDPRINLRWLNRKKDLDGVMKKAGMEADYRAITGMMLFSHPRCTTATDYSFVPQAWFCCLLGKGLPFLHMGSAFISLGAKKWCAVGLRLHCRVVRETTFFRPMTLNDADDDTQSPLIWVSVNAANLIGPAADIKGLPLRLRVPAQLPTELHGHGLWYEQISSPEEVLPFVFRRKINLLSEQFKDLCSHFQLEMPKRKSFMRKLDYIRCLVVKAFEQYDVPDWEIEEIITSLDDTKPRTEVDPEFLLAADHFDADAAQDFQDHTDNVKRAVQTAATEDDKRKGRVLEKTRNPTKPSYRILIPGQGAISGCYLSEVMSCEQGTRYICHYPTAQAPYSNSKHYGDTIRPRNLALRLALQWQWQEHSKTTDTVFTMPSCSSIDNAIAEADRLGEIENYEEDNGELEAAFEVALMQFEEEAQEHKDLYKGKGAHVHDRQEEGG